MTFANSINPYTLLQYLSEHREIDTSLSDIYLCSVFLRSSSTFEEFKQVVIDQLLDIDDDDLKTDIINGLSYRYDALKSIKEKGLLDDTISDMIKCL